MNREFDAATMTILSSVVVFLSAFLLFVVQPLLGRIILPWYGGTAAVWTTCMLFFQLGLLIGYAYAHLIVVKLSLRRQMILHVVLLACAVPLLPIGPGLSWKPAADENPVFSILSMLFVTSAPAYVLLSSTSPLLQAWLAETHPPRSPFRLFAVSNAASLAALVCYPILVEPLLRIDEQVRLWSWLFGAFMLLTLALSWMKRNQPSARNSVSPAVPKPAPGRIIMWISLSAVAAALLLSVTNHISQNIASVPLIWIVPLALYLLTFILAFGRTGLYTPTRTWGIVLGAIGAMAWFGAVNFLQFNIVFQMTLHLAGLFCVCLFCHGELFILKPAPAQLTAFYLAIATGGAAGGLFVGVVAPLVFNAPYELGISLIAASVLTVKRYKGFRQSVAQIAAVMFLGVVACSITGAFRFHRDTVASMRSFYGVVRVMEDESTTDKERVRRLVHGVVIHGEQFLDSTLRRTPTAYFHPSSGVGAAIRSLGRKPITVGVIGLGAATLASYGRPDDVYRFYEIDPMMVDAARRYFTFLQDTPAKTEIILGDGRISLEREAPNEFDVLVVDAFSGNAIPMHLMTVEALKVYLAHVKRDGIIAFQVTNEYVDLVAVVASLAKSGGLAARVVRVSESAAACQSVWVLLSREPEVFSGKDFADVGATSLEGLAEISPWTDKYSNLIRSMK